MEKIILQTKIIPEKNPVKILKRECLLQKLSENVNKKLIVISAGAGYGKTTIISDFIDCENIKAAWYKIDKSDDNIYIFFTYLTNAIAIIKSDFGKSSLQIIDSIKERANIDRNIDNITSTVAGTFINEFVQSIREDFYLILDDIHLLPKSTWVAKSLTYLFENAPSNLHFIIASREQLSVDIAKQRAKRKIFELDTKDLKFNENELKELAVRVYNLKLTESEAKSILNKFDGWITGLHLFLQSGKEGVSTNKFGESLPEPLYNYFAEDIFASESNSVKEFLLNTCMLDDFTYKTCNYLLNIKTSKKILIELLSRNIFIQQTESKPNGKLEYTYNYQELFKDFLRSKLVENKSEKERATLLKKIADYYLVKNDFVSAIKYFLFARDYEKSLQLILKNIERIGESSNIIIADKWIKALPVNIQEENPYVLYYKGCHCKNIKGNLIDAQKYFKNSLQKFKKIKDNKFVIRTYTLIAEILIKTGKIENAIEVITPLLKKHLNPADRSKLLYWLAVAYHSLTDYKKSLELLNKALEISNLENLETIKYSILNSLGNIYLEQGDYTKSLFYYENVIAHIDNIYNKLETLLNIVQVYAYSGKYEQAKIYLNEVEKIENLYPSQFFKLNFLLSSAYLYFLINDYESAINKWNGLLKIALKNNYTYYSYISFYNIALCNMYMRKFEKSKEFFDLASEIVKDLSEGEKIYFNYWLAILNKEVNISKVVEQNLKLADKYFEKNNILYDRTHAQFHLADYYLRTDKNDKALELISESIDAVSKKEYMSLVQKEILFKRNIFDFIVENKLKPELMSSIYYKVLNLENYDWVSDEFKRRLEQDIDNFYDINITCFGGLDIKIRGTSIPDDLWIRKIRKLIFAYIVLNHKKNLTKDRLLDLFYPDSTPENADNIFHQTLSNIRTAIKKVTPCNIPVLKSGKWSKVNTPSYITYQNQVLSLNQGYLYFVDAFDFENSYKKGTTPSYSDVEKKKHLVNTVNLYKGSFLEGYYQPWCIELRDMYERKYESALKNLVNLVKRIYEYSEISLYSEKLLKLDNLNEETYLDIIEAQVKLDNVTHAKVIIKQMYDTFDKELGEKPSVETSKKIKELLINV